MRDSGTYWKKHGLRSHPLYMIHRDMINRCYLKTRLCYKNYGGRGITVCEEWRNDVKAFYDWAISNGWRKGLEIDRINNNGNYEPSNCRIATAKINAQNRRNSHNLTWNGITMNLAEWANKTGIHYKLLYKRIKYENLSIGEAITIKRNYKRAR
jgi:hypothetical protein